MAASVQFRPQTRDLGVVMREVDEDLAIFLGMKNGENERIALAHINSFEEFDGSTSMLPKPDSLLLPNGLGEEGFQNLGDESLLSTETGKSDHDWLFAQDDSSNGQSISLKSELPKSTILDSSSAASNKRPKKPSSRAATPTRRSMLPAKSKSSSRASTPTSRAPSRPAAATTSSKPVPPQVRASTPISRATAPAASSKPVSRSSTPSRAAPRSSTPSARNSSSSKPASSSSAATTRKSAVSSASSSISASSGASSGGKTNSLAIKSTRGGSQTVKSRPSKQTSEMLSVSHNAPHSVKTSMPKRPASASRGRPSAPLSSPSKVKPRLKSCSPTKARASIGFIRKNGGMTTLSRSRGYNNGVGDGDDVNPVLMGTQMVERVVNMRKLGPPKQDEHASVENPKSSSRENSGFGRSLSKKSLDMAIRHMDFTRSVNSGNLKPVATSVMSYFSNGNQSSSSQSSSFGISESPVTSSSDSSKSSNCVDSYFLDGRN